jgi:hypothetical protein
MDDNKFDNELKNRLSEYEADEFDPAALAALHHQMASEAPTPWYTSRSTELMVGSGIIISTILIIWFQWYTNHINTEMLQSKLTQLETRLKDEEKKFLNPTYNPALSPAPPDTNNATHRSGVTPTTYITLLHKVDALTLALEQLRAETLEIHKERSYATKPDRDDDQQYITDQYDNPVANSRLTPRKAVNSSERADARDNLAANEVSEQKLSGRSILDIQRHYQQGIGIRLGPMAALSRASYTMGDGRYDFGVGILADFVLSPAISLETGIVHTLRQYHIPSADIAEANNLPGVDTGLGDLRSADIDSWIFEFPIQLKYRFPISLKAGWIAGIGYSQLFYTKQILEYDYQFNASQSASLNSSYKESAIKTYPGMLGLSLGFGNELKRNQFLETSIFYQHGLAKSGVEQTKPVFIGLRGAYWFSIR